MNTDRVEWSRYHVLRDGRVDLAFAATLENSAFRLEAKDGSALFTFVIDHPNDTYAMRHVQDFLTSWEGDMQLQATDGRREFRFAQLEMRSGKGVALALSMHVTVAGPRAEANHRRLYPWQNHRYQSVPLVHGLVQRYQGARSGAELPAVAGYFCLTVIERALGERSILSQRLRIQAKVLKKFGDLVSSVGTFSSARKIAKAHHLREFTQPELDWLYTVLRLLIDRFGQHCLGEVPTDELTMKELPPLRAMA